MGGRRRKPGKVRARTDYAGTVRYTALYLPGPNEDYISAGTFDTYDEAEAAWLTQADSLRRGTHVDPRKGRTLFRDFALLWGELYVADRVNTLKGYEDALRNHLLPTFGHLQLLELGPQTVADWIIRLKTAGYQPSTIRTLRGYLSGILTTAQLWQYIAVHPCAGVKAPKQGPRRVHSLTSSDVDALLAAVNSRTNPTGWLMIWLAVHSGLRWGEISELRGRDVILIDPEEDLDEFTEEPEDELVYLNVCRSVSDVGAKHADGGRFIVEDTPKSGRDRKVGLDAITSTKLLDYVELHEIGPGDLVFSLTRLQRELNPVPELKADLVDLIPDDLGRTRPNAQGRTYTHGTASGYGAGGCKCPWCRRAVAEYRAARRAAGLDLKPRRGTRGRNISDHIPRDHFRRNIWLPALAAATIVERATFHDLRHTHATWLARDGVSVEILRGRLAFP